ncbi:acyltransferase-domain-containing protein [Globomyces pollinis-pini]|nr:acyltransferase-domain-containing protein [Globomyces pollinis-pini]
MTEPISRMPTSAPSASWPVYIIQIITFSLILLGTAIAILAIQVPAMLLHLGPLPFRFFAPNEFADIKLFFRKQYKTVIRTTEQAFGTCMVFIVYFLTPGTKLVITGDHDKFKSIEKTILFANHQIYPDWVYIWMLARKYQRHGDVKIMLIAVLKYIPILGLGMQFFDFIFMQRKLALDKINIIENMKRQKAFAAHLPLWLMIYPEGTLNTPGNRDSTRAYAKKYDIKEDPKYVLLPKSTGLFMLSDALSKQLNSVFDLTVGYSGLEAPDIPYEEYLAQNVFFGHKYPKEIHIHVKHFQLNQLPGFEENQPLLELKSDSTSKTFVETFDAKTDQRRLNFATWVTKRFLVKDDQMKHFYNDGSFHNAQKTDGFEESNTEEWTIAPSVHDSMLLIFTWAIGYTFIRLYLAVFWLLLSFVF